MDLQPRTLELSQGSSQSWVVGRTQRSHFFRGSLSTPSPTSASQVHAQSRGNWGEQCHCRARQFPGYASFTWYTPRTLTGSKGLIWGAQLRIHCITLRPTDSPQCSSGEESPGGGVGVWAPALRCASFPWRMPLVPSPGSRPALSPRLRAVSFLPWAQVSSSENAMAGSLTQCVMLLAQLVAQYELCKRQSSLFYY